MQLLNAIRSNGKNNLKHSNTYSQNLILLGHHLLKSISLFNIEKFESREFYCIINSSRNNKSSLQMYFGKVWVRLEDHLYITTKSYHKHVLMSFQYKLVNSILYLNKKLFTFGLSATSFCTFCNFFWWKYHTSFLWLYNNTMLWKKLQLKLKDNITLLPLTSQAAIFSFFKGDCRSYLIQNQIFLISKLYIYKSRKSNF